MLYHLLFSLREIFSPFNVVRYITFRAAAAFITALIINFIIAPTIIKKFKEAGRLQSIRDDGPNTHLKKRGTPTMGGLIVIISLVFSVLLWARLDNPYTLILIGSTLWLGFLGFIDDYMKTVRNNSRGVTPITKLVWQGALGIFVAIYLYNNPVCESASNALTVPFFKDLFIHLGPAYMLFAALTVVGTSNAVNITDGLDGLAIGGIIFAALTYAVLAYIAGNLNFSEYLFLPYVQGAGEITIFMTALAGAGLGFLWFNIFPAEIFMGDTGSLFMGGVIGISALIIKHELLLIIVGGVFLMEIISVIIQVASFKLRGKRVFKMAPLHHHFELSGWSEPQVVIRFWIISIILALFAFSTLKLR